MARRRRPVPPLPSSTTTTTMSASLRPTVSVTATTTATIATTASARRKKSFFFATLDMPDCVGNTLATGRRPSHAIWRPPARPRAHGAPGDAPAETSAAIYSYSPRRIGVDASPPSDESAGARRGGTAVPLLIADAAMRSGTLTNMGSARSRRMCHGVMVPRHTPPAGSRTRETGRSRLAEGRP